MFRGSWLNRWNSLTTTQKVIIGVVGLIIVYAVLSGAGGRGFGLPEILAKLVIIFIAFPVHEFAHAAAAVALGDSTPRRQGRLTLNPIAHIDPIGAILLFLTGFGWARPVQWNPRNITTDVRVGSILVALAGPVSNLLLAMIATTLLRLGLGDVTFLGGFLIYFVYINVLLFVFNLIPIPPLDGSHVLFALLPSQFDSLRWQLSQYGFLLLFAFIFIAPGIVTGPTRLVMNLLFSGFAF